MSFDGGTSHEGATVERFDDDGNPVPGPDLDRLREEQRLAAMKAHSSDAAMKVARRWILRRIRHKAKSASTLKAEFRADGGNAAAAEQFDLRIEEILAEMGRRGLARRVGKKWKASPLGIRALGE